MDGQGGGGGVGHAGEGLTVSSVRSEGLEQGRI